MSNFQSQYTGQQIDEAIGKALTGGADGLTPYIKDGYWWIGEENTNVKAEGKDGVSVVGATLTLVSDYHGGSSND